MQPLQKVLFNCKPRRKFYLTGNLPESSVYLQPLQEILLNYNLPRKFYLTATIAQSSNFTATLT